MEPVTWTIGGIIGLVIFIVTVVSIVNNPNHGGVLLPDALRWLWR